MERPHLCLTSIRKRGLENRPPSALGLNPHATLRQGPMQFTIDIWFGVFGFSVFGFQYSVFSMWLSVFSGDLRFYVAPVLRRQFLKTNA